MIFPMAIPSQTRKEIIQMIEAFKAQLYDTLHDLADSLTLHDLVDGLKNSFRSIQDSLDRT